MLSLFQVFFAVKYAFWPHASDCTQGVLLWHNTAHPVMPYVPADVLQNFFPPFEINFSRFFNYMSFQFFCNS